ncbi:unnamed protein product [Effrenium voratum]|uniref:5-hmdU DNA kinase helical domain-containing protein n=1 Tax=Effrenium voratum TaxID=2562239 RepID=A0AA36J387_9DINO|nr:unnamed protein product [Effrenium voratum]CAJ1438368.1 unnamed protein product [Effrenium voratum]
MGTLPRPAKRARLSEGHSNAELPEPPLKGVKLLYDFMNARELVRKNRETGKGGARLYEGLPADLAQYFQRHCCPNVHRWHDRTTSGLHHLCAAKHRWRLCQTDSERYALKQLFILNFAVWRFIGGTVLFASEVGFLPSWGKDQKAWIRQVVTRAYRHGRIRDLFTDAYKGPGAIRAELSAGDEDSLERVLYNRGPKQVRWAEPDLTFHTLVGKFRLIDRLWEESPSLVDAAAPNPQTGRVEMRRVCEVLSGLPYFGGTVEGRREPGFFAKELVQDLLDTPVFGHRSAVADRFSYSPAGPGALEGLRLIYRRRITPCEAVPLMLKLLAYAHKLWKQGPVNELELHDIQFMLCELQKYLHSGASLRDYAGPPCLQNLPLSLDFVQKRLEEALVLHLFTAKGEESGRIARELADWLGLRLHQGEEIRDGDHVVLREAGSGALLELVNGLLQPAQRKATPFRVEARSGALCGQEGFFLRAPNGAHLGPTSASSAWGAPAQSGRFSEGRELSVDVGKVSLGQAVVLCPKWQTNDSCPKCFKLSLRVRFERDILTKTLEDELLDLVEQVVRLKLGTDDLGQLCALDPGKVRARLIGCEPSWTDRPDWQTRSARLTGNWEQDCGSL